MDLLIHLYGMEKGLKSGFFSFKKIKKTNEEIVHLLKLVQYLRVERDMFVT